MLILNDVEWNVNVDAHFIEFLATIEYDTRTSGMTLSGTEIIDFSGTTMTYDIPLDCSMLTDAEREAFFKELSFPKVQKIRLPDLRNSRDFFVLITEVKGGTLITAQGTAAYVHVEGITARVLGYWRTP